MRQHVHDTAAVVIIRSNVPSCSQVKSKHQEHVQKLIIRQLSLDRRDAFYGCFHTLITISLCLSLFLFFFCSVQACVGSRRSGPSRGTWPWGLEPRLCWSVKCWGPQGPCSGWRMACFWGHTGLCPATHATPWLVMRTEVKSRERRRNKTVVIAKHMQRENNRWFMLQFCSCTVHCYMETYAIEMYVLTCGPA